MTLADRPLHPGELVLVEFGPTRGTEQDGRRPALVVSVADMNAETRRIVVCPITSNTAPWATKVFLPAGIDVAGAVLTDQVRAIDRNERVPRRLGLAPKAVLVEVWYQLSLLLGLRTSGQESVASSQCPPPSTTPPAPAPSPRTSCWRKRAPPSRRYG